MVECYDEEQDDLDNILEIKKDVASDLERKIQQSRSKLQTKRLIGTTDGKQSCWNPWVDPR